MKLLVILDKETKEYSARTNWNRDDWRTNPKHWSYGDFDYLFKGQDSGMYCTQCCRQKEESQPTKNGAVSLEYLYLHSSEKQADLASLITV